MANERMIERLTGSSVARPNNASTYLTWRSQVPYDIRFDKLPMGIAAKAAPKEASTAEVRMRAYSSSEDGHAFVEQLEGFPTAVLALLPASANVHPSSVDHLLAIIRRDRTATVYVNELRQVATAKVKRAIRKGEAVRKDDILNVSRMSLESVTIPDDAGIIYLFSEGWRKGLYMDLEPLHPDHKPTRHYDYEIAFGQLHADLMFQELFRIANTEWMELFRQRWFPFRSLSTDTIRNMVSYAREGWNLDDLVETVEQEVRATLDDTLAGWKKFQMLERHIPLIEKAIQHFRERDYPSCTALMFPQIEGILRVKHTTHSDGLPATQKRLAEISVVDGEPSLTGRSPLLPGRFREYLESVYFARFDPNETNAPISRNSVAHGVAAVESYNLKAALLGLLILGQIAHYTDIRRKD